MSAARLLYELQRAGFHLSVDAQGLAVDGPVDRLTDATKAAIREHRRRLIGYCSPARAKAINPPAGAIADPHTRQALAELFHERAGIAEFDGGMSCADAERIAWREVADLAGEQAADAIAATEGRAER